MAKEYYVKVTDADGNCLTASNTEGYEEYDVLDSMNIDVASSIKRKGKLNIGGGTANFAPITVPISGLVEKLPIFWKIAASTKPFYKIHMVNVDTATKQVGVQLSITGVATNIESGGGQGEETTTYLTIKPMTIKFGEKGDTGQSKEFSVNVQSGKIQ